MQSKPTPRKVFPEILEDFLSALESCTSVSFTVHDFGDITRQKLPPSRTGHGCAYCQHIKSTAHGEQKCQRWDIMKAQTQAAKEQKPFIRTCHAGITECIVPISVHETIVGLIFCGQVFTDPTLALPVSEEIISKVPVKEKTFLLQVASVVDSYLKSIQPIINALADHTRSGHHTHQSIKYALELLNDQFTTSTSAQSIAQQVGLSASRFEHLFTNEVGCSFGKWIRKRRCREAMQLLESTNLRIHEIANHLGYEDSAYFCRVFKRETQTTPSTYRTESRQPPTI